MSSWRLIFVLPVVFAQPCVAQPTPLGNEARVALVVGVGNYSFERLQNPINDAVDLGAALRRLGFETTVLIDPSRKQIYESLDVLDRSLGRPNSVGLFFFAGHGAQVASRNYLIPIDAIPSSEADVLRLGIDVYEITRRFAAAGSSLNLIVLDACRTVANAPWQKVAAQGLAPVEAPKGTLIAFATAPGGYALDGTGRNGVYTGALLRHIESPGAPIEEVMKRVRNDIATSTRDRQIPWENTSLTRDFYFMPAKTGSSRTRGGPSVDGGDEEKSWLSVRDTSSIYELLTFVERFPKSERIPEAVAVANRIFAKIRAPTIEREDLLAMTGRTYAGIEVAYLGPQSARRLGLDYDGAVLVVDVDRGSPGDKVGLKTGDILLEVDGRRIDGQKAAEGLRGTLRPGELVEVLVLRGRDKLKLFGIIDRAPVDFLFAHAAAERIKSKTDVAKAVKYLEYLAASEIWRGDFLLGILHLAGLGTEKDLTKGMSLLTKSAEAGGVYPRAYLGLMLVDGREVPRDGPRGCALLDIPYRIGMPEGVYGRGVCAVRGYSGPEDRTGGIELIRRAAEDGFEPAKNSIKALEKSN